MAVRSRDFVEIAEGIKSQELSTKGKIEQFKEHVSELSDRKSSLKSTISYLEAAIEAAYEDTDEDDDPDYGRIASLESEKFSAENELAGVEQDIDITENELEISENELENVLEEKEKTLFEIEERARITSKNISLAGGMYGAYSGVGVTLQNSLQTSLSALIQASGILGGSVDGNGAASGGNTSSGARKSPSLAGNNSQSNLSSSPLAAIVGGEPDEGVATVSRSSAAQFSSSQIGNGTPGTLPIFRSGQTTINAQRPLELRSDQETNESAINAFSPRLKDQNDNTNPDRFITNQVSSKIENQILSVPHSTVREDANSVLFTEDYGNSEVQTYNYSFSDIARYTMDVISLVDIVSGLLTGRNEAIKQPNVIEANDLFSQTAIVSSETNNGGITADDAINSILSGSDTGNSYMENIINIIIDMGQAIDYIGSDIDQQAGVVHDLKSSSIEKNNDIATESTVGSASGSRSKHGFYD